MAPQKPKRASPGSAGGRRAGRSASTESSESNWTSRLVQFAQRGGITPSLTSQPNTTGYQSGKTSGRGGGRRAGGGPGQGSGSKQNGRRRSSPAAAKAAANYSAATREETRETLKEKRRKMKLLKSKPEFGVRERPLPRDIEGSYTMKNLRVYMAKDSDNLAVATRVLPIHPVQQVLHLTPRPIFQPGIVLTSNSAGITKMCRTPMAPTPPPVEERPPMGFWILPREVRNMIYRHLVLHEGGSNIMVQKGWTQVFGRHRPCLPITKIAALGQQFADEALAVLYGENTFEYFFRDAAESMGNAVDGSDGTTSAAASSDDAAFSNTTNNARNNGGGAAAANGRAARNSRRKKKNERAVIPINEHGHRIRNIVLRIESNRTGPEYRVIMAEALRVFVELAPYRANLHTVTVDVSPTWRDGDEVSYTDYFVHDSPITMMLKALPCQFIKVLIHTPRHRTVECLINRRYQAAIRRSGRGRGEYNLNNDVSINHRKVMADEEWAKLNTIANLIEQECTREAEPLKSASPAAMGMDIDDFGEYSNMMALSAFG